MKTAARSRDCRCEISPARATGQYDNDSVAETRLRALSLDPNLALDILRTHPVAVIDGLCSRVRVLQARGFSARSKDARSTHLAHTEDDPAVI
jgi:hypothetical protein